MEPDAWPLVSAATMRALDRHTIEVLGIPAELLMECAGRAVATQVVASRAPGAGVWVACGTGSNGGDGLVAARHLHLQGVPVRVVCLGDPERLAGDAGANLARARALGIPVASGRWKPEPGATLVDALFGTGLERPLQGEAEKLVGRLNASRARDSATRVIAVDLPSGLAADTGQALGVAVSADLTVTLGLPKLGLALEPGRSLAGRVVVARIGIADSAPGVAWDATLLTRAGAGACLPERPVAAHKGHFGHVLVVAGSEGKTGAAALAAAGAARAGSGLVTIACPESLNGVLETLCTEAMTAPVAETAGRALGLAAEKALLDLAAARDVTALGPGLGRADETAELVRRLARGIAAPLVLDADALLAFADEPEALARRRAPTLLTPHPGEASALLHCPAAEINADRIGAARRLAECTGATVLLKGSASVVASAGGRVAVTPTGGPNLASGGTGDVLTGVVAALLAQRVGPFEAAAVGSYLHGLAADRLARREGPAGLLAGDLARALPVTMQTLRRAARAPHAPLGVGDALRFPEPG